MTTMTREKNRTFRKTLYLPPLLVTELGFIAEDEKRSMNDLIVVTLQALVDGRKV